MTDAPTPDEFGRYRVAETVDGQTRHYSTSRFIPDVHTIVEGPDAAASFANGQERPAKFPTTEDDGGGEQAPEPAPAPQESPPTRPATRPATTEPATADSTEAVK